MATDREILGSGIRTLMIALVLMFLAPFTIYEAFKNQEHPLYIPVLILGLILAVLAVYSGFKGVKKVSDAFFNGQ